MITDDSGTISGGVLISIQKDYILKHLVEIAGLNESFYSKCEIALDGLSDANHIYQSLVNGPDKHFPYTPENYYEGLIDYGLEQLNDSIVAVQELFLACTGSVLEHGKLR